MREINIALASEEVFSIGQFSVTNTFISMVSISIVLLLVFIIIARRLKTVPGKGQFFVEAFVEGVYGFVLQVAGSEKVARRLFPMFAVFSIFFLASNLIGIIPGFGALTVNDVALWRPPTTDYGLIFGLTVLMFFVWQFVAIVTGGLVHYTGKFINFSGFKQGVIQGFIDLAMGVLDIIGEIAKIISLSFRLFGNIFAGEAIFAVLMGLAPYVVPVPFVALSLLSGVIQAFVFPILVLIFITMSIETRDAKASARDVNEKQDRKAQNASA